MASTWGDYDGYEGYEYYEDGYGEDEGGYENSPTPYGSGKSHGYNAGYNVAYDRAYDDAEVDDLLPDPDSLPDDYNQGVADGWNEGVAAGFTDGARDRENKGGEMTEEELDEVVEEFKEISTARAPSCSTRQPWRYRAGERVPLSADDIYEIETILSHPTYANSALGRKLAEDLRRGYYT